MLEPKNGDYVSYIAAIEADTLYRLRKAGLKALDEGSLNMTAKPMPTFRSEEAQGGLSTSTWGRTDGQLEKKPKGSIWEKLTQRKKNDTPVVASSGTNNDEAARRRRAQAQDRMQFGGIALAGIGIFASLARLNEGATLEELFPFPGLLFIIGVVLVIQASKVRKG